MESVINEPSISMKAYMSPIIAIDQFWKAFALVTYKLTKKAC